MSSLDYSVIIPSKNPSNLISCVAAIRANEPNLNPSKIIVIDDGAKTIASETSVLDGVTWIEGIKPFVYARNCNLGIKHSADNVILLNDDALLKTKNGFTNLVNVSKDYGIVSAVTNSAGNLAQCHKVDGMLRDEPRMVCFICTCIPRFVIDEIGILDENFQNCYGFEDDDYCLRARRVGLKLAVFSGCFVDHLTLISTFRGRGRHGDLREGERIFRKKWGAGNHEL